MNFGFCCRQEIQLLVKWLHVASQKLLFLHNTHLCRSISAHQNLLSEAVQRRQMPKHFSVTEPFGFLSSSTAKFRIGFEPFRKHSDKIYLLHIEGSGHEG